MYSWNSLFIFFALSPIPKCVSSSSNDGALPPGAALISAFVGAAKLLVNAATLYLPDSRLRVNKKRKPTKGVS